MLTYEFIAWHIFRRTKSYSYSLCGISKALKFSAVPPWYHWNGASLYGDRAVELQPSGAGALVSARCAFWSLLVEAVSTPVSPWLLFDIDCPLRPLPSRFSIKKDDALDEVGAWLSVCCSCMLSLFLGGFTRKPSWSCPDGVLRRPKVVISSVAASGRWSDEESWQRRDGDLLGARGKRGRQGNGSGSTVKRLYEPRVPSDWTSTIANGVFQGKENYCLSASAAAAAALCVCSCRPVPSRPSSQQKISVNGIQYALFGSIRVQIKIKIGQGSSHPPGRSPPVPSYIGTAYGQLLTSRDDSMKPVNFNGLCVLK